MSISFSDISSLRLQNQHIASQSKKTAKELITCMGAIQAQEYNQAKWAIGLRLPHLTESQIELAFNQGEIIRTHLMRPTWHFVSSDDIYWMLELTAPQIRSSTKSRHRDLELTEPILKKGQEILIRELEGNHALSREELKPIFKRGGINTDEQRFPHIMMAAELDGIVCSGKMNGNKQTYALLSERVPVKKTLTKEEALAKLAKKYFESHGPASLSDFVWWSGLNVSDARKALEINKSCLISAVLENETYWYAEPASIAPPLTDSAYLLPAFDEYLISYKNRSAAITADHHKKAISNNGIFWPVIVVNGKISGLWKRTFTNNSVVIELDHFRPHNKKEVQLIEEASEKYGYFSARNAVLKPK